MELSITSLEILERLTPKEREVVTLLLKTGGSNVELAEKLHMGVRTLQQHLVNVHRKLKIRTAQRLFDLLPDLVPITLEKTPIQLTPRERQVVELLGYTNAQIAENLGLSERTIESFLVDIYQKAMVTSRRKLLVLRPNFDIQDGRSRIQERSLQRLNTIRTARSNGLTHAAIAEMMGISQSSVTAYIRRIYA